VWRMSKHAGGRPPKYTNAEEVQELIDVFFAERRDSNRPLTIQGLAIALDLSRQGLLNYSKKDEFFDTIRRARQIVVDSVEENALTGGGAGAIFWLKNNAQYRDKIETDHTSSDGSMSPKQAVDPALSKAIIDALDKTI